MGTQCPLALLAAQTALVSLGTKKAPRRCWGGRMIAQSMAHGLPRSECNTQKKEKPRTWNFEAFPQSEPSHGMAVALESIV